MNLFFVRHGRQSSPLCNVDVDLSQQGIMQVELLAKRIEGIPFDIIYSSDLKRAIQTASMINETHHLQHEIRSGIREIDFGDLTGKEDSVIYREYADFFEANAMLEEDIPYPGGESGGDVVVRAIKVVEEILSSGKENVLIITHGGVIRALTAHFLGLDMAKKGMFGTALEHTSITEFVYKPELDKMYLQRFNDFAHLEEYPELMRNSWKK